MPRVGAHHTAHAQDQTRLPGAQRHDIKYFIYKPIPRLARYELLLKSILAATSEDHEDKTLLPPVIKAVHDLLQRTEFGLATSKGKVDAWKAAQVIFADGVEISVRCLFPD